MVLAAGASAEFPPVRTEPLGEQVSRIRRKVADGADAEPGQRLFGFSTDHGEVADRPGRKERRLAAGRDHQQAIGFGGIAGDLRDELVRRHAHRSGDADLVPDPSPDVAGDRLRFAVKPLAAGDVQVRLVGSCGLIPGRVLAKDRVELLRRGSVVGEVRLQEYAVWAQPARLRRGHGRVDSEPPRLVAAGVHHTAWPQPTAHDHGLAAQLGPPQQLHRDVEGIKVDVQDGRVSHSNIRSDSTTAIARYPVGAMATIGIIGAGAVGSYYGGLLARAGHDVRFLFRSDLDAVRERGLQIRSKDGDFRIERVAAFGSPAEIGTCDWVVCALKATAMDEARGLVAPCIGPDTRILTLMNGLGIEEQFAGWFGAGRVYGGMAFVCLNRVAPGVVRHIDYGRVTIGHALDEPVGLEDLRALLAGAGIEVVTAPSLRYARWEKLCWNVPFNGLSVAAGGVDTATILADDALRGVAEMAMREVVAAGNADLDHHGSPIRLDADDVVERMFAQTATMGGYRTSMVIDYVLGRALEVEAILGEPARRAVGLGVHTPAMHALYALVRAADRRRRGLLQPLLPEDVLEVEVDTDAFAPGRRLA